MWALLGSAVSGQAGLWGVATWGVAAARPWRLP